MTYDRITVLTPSIPGREEKLAEAIASVNAQTLRPYAHLIRVQRPDEPGPVHLAEQRNALLEAATTEWVAWLDDDDLWNPGHLEVVSQYFADADVVYSWAETGPVAREDVTGWPREWLLDRLRQGNVISSNSCCRRSMLMAVGGYPTRYDFATGTFVDTPATFEDWAMWIALADAGARFVCVPQLTWHYRHHPESITATWHGTPRLTAPSPQLTVAGDRIRGFVHIPSEED